VLYFTDMNAGYLLCCILQIGMQVNSCVVFCR